MELIKITDLSKKLRQDNGLAWIVGSLSVGDDLWACR